MRFGYQLAPAGAAIPGQPLPNLSQLGLLPGVLAGTTGYDANGNQVPIGSPTDVSGIKGPGFTDPSIVAGNKGPTMNMPNAITPAPAIPAINSPLVAWTPAPAQPAPIQPQSGVSTTTILLALGGVALAGGLIWYVSQSSSR